MEFMHKCSLWRIPGLAGVMFPIFAKIIAVVPFSSDVLAGLSRNKERTEKLIANTGSKSQRTVSTITKCFFQSLIMLKEL